MWLESIHLKNTKGFIDSDVIKFSRGLNVLVGANNAGKSTILRSAQLLQPTQATNKFFENANRSGTARREIFLVLKDINRDQININTNFSLSSSDITFRIAVDTQRSEVSFLGNGSWQGLNNPICKPHEPDNLCQIARTVGFHC
jgi:predicted ATP-dependent endonuclease of OLD family